MPIEGDVNHVAGFQAHDGFVVSECFDHQTIKVWSPGSHKSYKSFDVRSIFDSSVRSMAIAEVDVWGSQKILALAPDYDATTLVQILEVHSHVVDVEKDTEQFDSGAHWRGPAIQGLFALADGSVAVLTDMPLEVRALASNGNGASLDSVPDNATVAFALTGRKNTNAAFVISDSDDHLVLPRIPNSISKIDGTVGCGEGPLRLDEPSAWPRTAICWGQIGDRSIVATGSIGGAVWIWDAESWDVVAGPLAQINPEWLELGAENVTVKGGPSNVVSLALGHDLNHGDIAAVVYEGRVRLVSLLDGRELPNPTEGATVITAVALGRIWDKDMLVTGSKGGVLIVWDLQKNNRVAALTLDHPIDRVWIVHGIDAVAAQSGQDIYVCQVLLGSEIE